MVIDASVWVAAFLKKDAHHLESVDFLRSLVATAVTVELPNLALAEISGAVARQVQDSAIARAVVQFVQSRTWVKCRDTSLHLATLAADIAASCFLRGADAIYVALAVQLQIPLITLDNEMLIRGKGLVTTLTPADWLQNNPP